MVWKTIVTARAVLFLFAAIVCVPRAAASAQLFGPSGSTLFSIDPSTGVATTINPAAPFYCDMVTFRCAVAFNSSTHTMFLTGSGSNSLFAADTRTGAVSTVATLAYAPTALIFDPGTGKLFGPTSSGFVSIDPATGTEVILNPVVLTYCCGYSPIPLAFDAATHTMFTVDNTGNLLAINTTTGGVSTVAKLANSPNTWVFDPGSGKLVGPADSLTGFDILSIDPATGTIVTLNSYKYNGAAVYTGVFPFDPVTHTMFSEIGLSGPLLAINTLTGNVVSLGVYAVSALIFDPGTTSSPPVAVNETATTSAGVPVTIDLSAGASRNPTSAAVVGTPVAGTVSIASTSATFTPVAGFNGKGSFQFTLANGYGTSNIATATITVAPTLLDVKTKVVFLDIGSSAKDASNALNYASLVLQGPKNLIQSVASDAAKNVAIKALIGNDQLSGQTIDFTTNVAHFAAFELQRLTPTNVLSLPLQIDSQIFGLVSLVANVVANDPPDPNYKVVFIPQKLVLPTTGNAILDRIENDYLQYSSFLSAALHAAERWQGATLAKDTVSASLQRNAYVKYSQEAALVKLKLNVDNVILASVLPQVSINSFTGGAAAIAAAYNAQCGTPLPSDLNNALLALPLTQTQINKMVCDYVSGITPSSISTDFKKALLKGLP